MQACTLVIFTSPTDHHLGKPLRLSYQLCLKVGPLNTVKGNALSSPSRTVTQRCNCPCLKTSTDSSTVVSLHHTRSKQGAGNPLLVPQSSVHRFLWWKEQFLRSPQAHSYVKSKCSSLPTVLHALSGLIIRELEVSTVSEIRDQSHRGEKGETCKKGLTSAKPCPDTASSRSTIDYRY